MATRKIYRSREDRMIGGICGGLAEYFDVDSTLIRLALLILFFASGVGLLVYIVAWIVVPEKPLREDKNNNATKDGAYNTGSDFYDNKGSNINDNQGGDSDADTATGTQKANNTDYSEQRRQIIGYALIGLGAIFLFDNWLPYFRWERFWPLVLVGAGIYLLLKGVRENE